MGLIAQTLVWRSDRWFWTLNTATFVKQQSFSLRGLQLSGDARERAGRQADEARPAGKASSHGAAASATSQPLTPQQVIARRGVAPGSFIDLLLRSTDRTTGKGLTDYEIANQVAHRAQDWLSVRRDPGYWRMLHAPRQGMSWSHLGNSGQVALAC